MKRHTAQKDRPMKLSEPPKPRKQSVEKARAEVLAELALRMQTVGWSHSPAGQREKANG
jgi:hypothetical protein